MSSRNAINDLWRRIVKTSGTARNTTTSLTADPDIQFSMSASKTYSVRGCIYLAADATPDIKWDFNGPAASGGGNNDFLIWYSSQTANNLGTLTGLACNGYTNTAVTMSQTSFFYGSVCFQHNIAVGASPGTWSFRWAQNSSSGNDCYCRAGSWVEFVEI